MHHVRTKSCLNKPCSLAGSVCDAAADFGGIARRFEEQRVGRRARRETGGWSGSELRDSGDTITPLGGNIVTSSWSFIDIVITLDARVMNRISA